MPDSPSQSLLNDDGSLRKSGRIRKRPLAPDATYEHARSKRIDQSSTPMPFSPDKFHHGSDRTGDSPIQNGATDGGPAGDDGDDDEPEEEPVWAEFSSDYYQVVEQLPLELHRNFALLRELDEQTQRQTGRLLELIRQYAKARLAAVGTPPSRPGQPLAPNGISTATTIEQPFPSFANGVPTEAASMNLDSRQGQEMSGIPSAGSLESAAAGPSRHNDAIPEAHQKYPHSFQVNGNTLYSVTLTSNLLPEIGRLAREVTRGAEEKVGIAHGCYNSVDRHVRSMDAALQAQQAAANFGIRPGTLPSEMVTGTVGLGASGAEQAPTQEAMSIFSGGRDLDQTGGDGRAIAVDGLNVGLIKGAGTDMGAGRASESDTGPIPVVLGYVAAQSFDLKVDPNEPRYCYCGNVSHGEMMGCENEDCPHGGWFHLSCLGLTTPPKDRWWCKDCQPGGKANGNGSLRGKKSKRGKKAKR